MTDGFFLPTAEGQFLLLMMRRMMVSLHTLTFMLTLTEQLVSKDSQLSLHTTWQNSRSVKTGLGLGLRQSLSSHSPWQSSCQAPWWSCQVRCRRSDVLVDTRTPYRWTRAPCSLHALKHLGSTPTIPSIITFTSSETTTTKPSAKNTDDVTPSVSHTNVPSSLSL